MISELSTVGISISMVGVFLSSDLVMGGWACRLGIEPECTIWSSLFKIFFIILVLCSAILIYLGLKKLKEAKK